MSGWVRAHQSALLLTLVAIATALRTLLVIRSPTMYGYVYDFYHEGIQKFYALGRLPIATDCWQCYHPPVFYLIGLPFYALGKRIVAGPVGLADPALRFVGILSIASATATAYYSYRMLRLYRVRGAELVVGTGLILVFPCLFISTYGLEADILLTALMTAFMYYAVTFSGRSRPAHYMGAVRIGLIAGLACETKYTGLLAPVILVTLTGLGIAAGPQRWRIAREAAAALVVCALIGSWKYVDNFERYGTLLFANGSAQQGLVIAGRPSFASTYDFHSLRVADLVALTRGEVPPGHLTDLPFYRSVWTTLHAMAWSDMSFFSDPSRHGFRLKPYPRKHLNPWLASSVLILGLVPDGLAVIGFLVTLRRRVLWPLAATCVLTGAAYVAWFLAQESWALKTKYILFLLPAYVLYALLGGRWLQRLVPVAGRIVWLALAALVVAAHLYLLDFACS
jgi:4-amino-4-deoxy-L-arabinose transferase-like glycosyltransferase